MLPLAEHETIKFPCVCGIPAFFKKKKNMAGEILQLLKRNCK